MSPPRSLLLIKPGSMGDVIHALPVASAIHDAWPDTRVTWLVDARWGPLLDGNPAIAATRIFPRQEFRGFRGTISSIRWVRELKDIQPDLCLDLQGLLRSGIMAKQSRAKSVIGLSDAREGAGLFYDQTIPIDAAAHAVDRYLACLPALGIAIPAKKLFSIYNVKTTVSNSLQSDYIVVHPFSRGAGKALGADVIHALIAQLAQYANRKIVLVGFGKINLDGCPAVIDLVGQTSLSELGGVIAGAAFVVSVDSGPMHLAAALGVPLLGIHTWSDPRKVGPYDERAWIWQGGEIRRQDLANPPLPEAVFGFDDAKRVAAFVSEQVG